MARDQNDKRLRNLKMKAPKSNSQKTLVPSGTHIARTIGLIYIGTIESEWKGEKKSLYKIRLTWELPNKTHVFKEGDKPKPFTISREFTFSMGPKSNLRPIVEGIIGTSLKDEEANNFDLNEVLGKPCLISVSHEEGQSGVYAAVKSCTPIIEGMTCPPQINETKVLDYSKWDQEYFDSLPDFIKEKIESSNEYKLKMRLDPLRKPVSVTAEPVNLEDIPAF